jgi:hypothetical protein
MFLLKLITASIHNLQISIFYIKYEAELFLNVNDKPLLPGYNKSTS